MKHGVYKSSNDQLDPRTRVLSFSHHAKVYGAVNALLFLIDVVTGNTLWFFWPLLGWGVGLLVHYVRSFGFMPWVSADWENMMIRELESRDGPPAETPQKDVPTETE